MPAPFPSNTIQHRISTSLHRYRSTIADNDFDTLVENIVFLIRAGTIGTNPYVSPSQISVMTTRSKEGGIGKWKVALMLHGHDGAAECILEAQADGSEDVLRELTGFVNTMLLKAAEQYGVWKS
jgi:hypothetical protein